MQVAARVRMAAIVMVVAGLAGCATLPDGDRWGEHAGFRVGWDRTGDAAIHAARDPWVWAPLAGAAVMQIDNWDHRVSSWAVDNTPVFGSVQNAHDWSDYLQDAAGVAYLASLAATPSGDYGADWWDAKLRGAMVGLGAMVATGVTKEALNLASGRQRPDGGQNSFPSGHTSFAAVADTLTARNLESIPMNDGARTATIIGVDALTFATGWARVEAGAHYPSDVLVGMSIGNFFGRMFSDAFLGDGLEDRVALSVEPARGGAEIVWAWRF
jgi:membrane-associated phospholipid phosphatase